MKSFEVINSVEPAFFGLRVYVEIAKDCDSVNPLLQCDDLRHKCSSELS